MYRRSNIPVPDNEFDAGIKPYLTDDDYEMLQRTVTAAEAQSINPYPESECAPAYLNPEVPYEAVEYPWSQGIIFPDLDINVPTLVLPYPQENRAGVALCCMAKGSGEWAAGYTKPITVFGRNCPRVRGQQYVEAVWRIIGVELRWASDGDLFQISGFSGGINRATFLLTASAAAADRNSVPVRVFMETADCPYNREIGVPVNHPCTPEIYIEGGPCGCADLAWDYENTPEYIEPGGYVPIYLLDPGGICGPFTWTVDKPEMFWLAVVQTRGLFNFLFATEDACGPVKVTAVGCDEETEVSEYVKSTDGAWLGVNSGWASGCNTTGEITTFCDLMCRSHVYPADGSDPEHTFSPGTYCAASSLCAGCCVTLSEFGYCGYGFSRWGCP